jgi:hypothetical protein
MKWTMTAEGTLSLEGTPMSIVYSPSLEKGEFIVFQWQRQRCRCARLTFAKSEAERIYTELAEIGVA